DRLYREALDEPVQILIGQAVTAAFQPHNFREQSVRAERTLARRILQAALLRAPRPHHQSITVPWLVRRHEPTLQPAKTSADRFHHSSAGPTGQMFMLTMRSLGGPEGCSG